MNFLHILQGQSFGLQSFIFCLKIFKLSAFFSSAGKSFQRIAPIVLKVTNSLKTKFIRSYVSSVHGDTTP